MKKNTKKKKAWQIKNETEGSHKKRKPGVEHRPPLVCDSRTIILLTQKLCFSKTFLVSSS